uniref:Uncharacterized protein n=1 Tax=Caenorhabditis japonica TaxID=281687 RepID=A0A8R1EJ79_CAEJA
MNTTQQSTHGIFQNAIESVLYETSKFPEKPTESDEILHNLTNVSNVVSIIESGGFEPPKPSTLKRVHTGLKDSPRISERISKMFRNRVALSDFGKLNERWMIKV